MQGYDKRVTRLFDRGLKHVNFLYPTAKAGEDYELESLTMQLWKALAYLYPNAQPLRDYTIVERDGVQTIAQWNLPQPQPTDAELQAAETAYDAAQAQRQADSAALRQQVVTLAQSAVGLPINTLTAAQVRALVAVLLWKAGALDKNGNVNPLGSWMA